MKPQYFIAILFATSLYWMYLLYAPFLMVITIAALLAVSTSTIQDYFEEKLHSKLLAASVSSLLLALLFFAPLGYFLGNLTIWLKHLQPDTLQKVELYINGFITNPPEFLLFIKPYIKDSFAEVNINTITAYALSIAAKIGAFSAGFLKNAFLVIVFYFFALYNGAAIMGFLKRVLQMSVEESSLLTRELSAVMSVVFYSIITTAMFEGALFGIAVSFMGYNGLLFGIMYGFASLIPVVGGALMWLPFMIYEFAIGNSGSAIFIALYSIVVISIVADTFVKPLIIKWINKKLLNDDDTKMNEMVIFFAIIAGLTTFGFWGMILGPAITAFFLTVLKLFEAQTRECEGKSNDD
ncbi:AI-2E family transporter [Sulfurimonas paralvinellae]|uniref:AI-2E family transporter n=1 Tax=Sulfurimonas paralvinellae TaxID=317658 RepID=A0A7M1B987_9BACT|nr:AI-2E family transporter [Sulfurimonas paralvinellae]QOP46283.1 AI-2E family transporter [Sulfurimonas paralvinellae]